MSASNKTNTKKPTPDTNKLQKQEIKTDLPLSEKDEVKKAEERMKKQTKGK
ncbi:hypothetical protein [Mucilaginibacter ginsenosidivorax]|uniref:hypothetical protein n=1 Tax=Mucilaginibacter ginsenosidivorax TaxID=862126 RepID=UPI0013155935|nr:hypothetical protein [Mucilaginibacter ginsenosidivorax]